VLWVRDARTSAEFYERVLGFEIVATMGDQGAFLRADGSTNDHDLGLFSVGQRPSPAPHSPGLYHLAWQVPTIEDLALMRTRLLEAGALVGESDHGASKSLYAVDPDGIEFEVMWAVPKENWPGTPRTSTLDLDAELARWAAVDTADQ
jgi:catechol-2,3-dioxygenase